MHQDGCHDQERNNWPDEVDQEILLALRFCGNCCQWDRRVRFQFCTSEDCCKYGPNTNGSKVPGEEGFSPSFDIGYEWLQCQHCRYATKEDDENRDDN